MSWDDGKHTKVKRVQLTFDDAIRSIEVEYEGTSLKSQPHGTVGTKLDGFTLTSDEYITEVNGYSKTTFSGEVITSLTFKTNKKTYGTYGNKTSNYFSDSAPKDKQIAGFRGSSSHALNSIDAHFAPVPPPGSTSGNTGGTTETGSNPGGIESNTGGNGSNTGGPETNTSNSETTGGPGTTGGNGSNSGSGTTVGPGTTGGNGSNTGSGTTGGPGLNTDSGTTGGPGTTAGNGSNTGSGTTGGPGTTGCNGSNTGSETTGGPGTTGGNGSNTNSGTTGGNGSNTGDSGNTGSGSNNNSSLQKLEAQGGKEGNQWDDGADHDGVTKIHVAEGGFGIEQIKFDYVKNGESKEGPFHGVKGRGGISSFLINHPDEYLVSVEGWYDKSTNIIQGIQFKTNTKTSKYFGYDFFGEGPQFSLGVKDKKIIGFHGFADSHLNSLGAYFVPVSSSSSSLTPPAKKVDAQGGNYGEPFDDGAFDHVRKVYVGQGDSGVAYVKFDYEKDGKKETRDHGKMSLLGTEEFEVDSGDYITSIDVYVDKVYGYKSEIIIALTFKTFKGKTSPRFGFETESKYELKDGKGGKLAGFHGKASDVLYALGAYFVPVSSSSSSLTPPANRVDAQGGNYGEPFDDGAFDHVRKVYVGQGDSGVAYVKFDYEKDGKKETRDHGKMSLLGTEEFEVDSGDYITSIDVYVDKVYGYKSEIIIALTFKTFKGKSSPRFGFETENKYELKDGKGGKLAGFHGKASDVLYAIGAYFTPTGSSAGP